MYFLCGLKLVQKSLVSYHLSYFLESDYPRLPTVNKEKFVKAWNSMKKNSQLNNEKEIEGSVLSNWMFNFQGQRKSGFE